MGGASRSVKDPCGEAEAARGRPVPPSAGPFPAGDVTPAVRGPSRVRHSGHPARRGGRERTRSRRGRSRRWSAGREQQHVRLGRPGRRLLVERGERGPGARAPDRREGAEVFRRDRPAAPRCRDDTPVEQRAGADPEEAGRVAEPPPQVRLRDQVHHHGRRARPPCGEFAGEPVPRQPGVAQGGGGGPGQCQVGQMLAAVEVELARQVDRQRPRRHRRGAKPGQHGLRVQRVGQFHDRRRLCAGQRAGRYRRQRGQHRRRVHRPSASRRRRRQQQRRSHLVHLVARHSSTVTFLRARTVTPATADTRRASGICPQHHRIECRQIAYGLSSPVQQSLPGLVPHSVAPRLYRSTTCRPLSSRIVPPTRRSPAPWTR